MDLGIGCGRVLELGKGIAFCTVGIPWWQPAQSAEPDRSPERLRLAVNPEWYSVGPVAACTEFPFLFLFGQDLSWLVEKKMVYFLM